MRTRRVSHQRTDRTRCVPLIATLLLAGNFFVLQASPASATSPGSNGLIGVEFWRNITLETSHINTVDEAGTTFHTLIRLDTRNPAWSPDGSMIAFEYLGIWVAGADGGNPHSISTPCALEPSWSPDGGRIACVRYSPQDVFVVDLVTGVATQVTSGSLIGNRDPAWSPDGARIAFTTYVDGHSHVAVINPDGSDPVVLTAGSQTDSHPTWSPNGRRIAFARYGGGSYQIFVMNADGTELQQITSGGFNDAPSWSPDGTRIAFDGGTSDVLTMNPDGSDVVNVTGPLTHGISASYNPDWQPACTIVGTEAADVLVGTAARDVICGLDGSDTIYGLSGDDVIFGGGGPDRIEGGLGNDVIAGGPGADSIRAGFGSDLVNTEDGFPGDAVRGGEGHDMCLADPGDSVAHCP